MKTGNPTRAVMLACGLLIGANSLWAQDWPQWRGPNRDNKATGFTEPKTWPKELTKKWNVPVGAGDSSPVLVGDKLYVFARVGPDEVISCLDAANGKEVWKEKYKATEITGIAGGIHAGPRSTPAVAEGKVCTLGARGAVSCWDAASGKLVWQKNTGGLPKFFTSSSPLITDGKCIVYAEGLTAFDLASGEAKWKWNNAEAPYGSPILMTVDGIKMIVTPTKTSIVGIGLADGKLLWEHAFSAKYMNNTPIAEGQTVIYSAQGTGTIALKIEKKDDAFKVKVLWNKTAGSGQYNTPVLKDGLLFGLSAKGKGAANVFCMDALTGQTLWTDGNKQGDCGAIIDAGSVLVGLSSDKKLFVFEASKKAYMPLAEYTVAETATWAYPILAGNRVFVKDQNSLTLWTIE